ncbi:fibronectin type III domain-containing protein [Granulicella arctica]|uniref:fibronectin type III domain-containing protein n=1 Tax=Granulicella arctica TaxID=940613 RepID=UPI0021E032F7|nr:fibronectin type III domain-containing protein [Granulicella arctica]
MNAERVGDEVKLHWTTPAKTTDELTIKGATIAEICRTIAPTAHCSLTRRLAVRPGSSETTDLLSPDLVADPQRLIQYQVTLVNDQERSAGLSAPAFAAAGSAPPTVTHIRVRTTAEGALLQWEPRDATDAIELSRLRIDSPVTLASGKQTAAKAANEPAGLHLRARKATSADAPFLQDAGGTLDATARRGVTYTYTAQRVRKVVLGGKALEIRSAPSAPVQVLMRDSFPPRAPSGLETIASAPIGAGPTIDLSWRPNTEVDLAGYIVYRQDLDANGAAIGSAARLTPTPVQEPGFKDASVIPGHIYSYTVTAVDNTGNESSPGAPSREEIHP